MFLVQSLPESRNKLKFSDSYLPRTDVHEPPHSPMGLSKEDTGDSDVPIENLSVIGCFHISRMFCPQLSFRVVARSSRQSFVMVSVLTDAEKSAARLLSSQLWQVDSWKTRFQELVSDQSDNRDLVILSALPRVNVYDIQMNSDAISALIDFVFLEYPAFEKLAQRTCWMQLVFLAIDARFDLKLSAQTLVSGREYFYEWESDKFRLVYPMLIINSFLGMCQLTWCQTCVRKFTLSWGLCNRQFWEQQVKQQFCCWTCCDPNSGFSSD